MGLIAVVYILLIGTLPIQRAIKGISLSKSQGHPNLATLTFDLEDHGAPGGHTTCYGRLL